MVKADARIGFVSKGSLKGNGEMEKRKLENNHKYSVMMVLVV